MTSNKSTQAFQTADSGMEIMMKKIKDQTDRTTVTIGSLGTCNAGKIILPSEDVGKGTAEISFFSVDEDGIATRIAGCGENLSEIDEIKSIGSYGDAVRAVQMKVTKNDGSNPSETTPDPTACILPWGGTIDNGKGVDAYKEGSVACGSDCKKETRTCNNGTLSGSYTKQNCSVESCGGASCTLPWGGTITDGSSVTAYAANSVSCGSTCRSQTRTCNNGVLSGSYTKQACSVGACSPEMSITGNPIVTSSDPDSRSVTGPSIGDKCRSGSTHVNLTSFFIWNYNLANMQFTATTSNDWISLNIGKGPVFDGNKSVSLNFSAEYIEVNVVLKACPGMSPGTHKGSIRVTSTNAVSGAPVNIPVTFTIYPENGVDGG